MAPSHGGRTTKTKGRIQIELHAGGALGNDASMTDAPREGKLEMTGSDSATVVRLSKPFGVINFSFLMGSETDADLLLDSPFGKDLLATLPTGHTYDGNVFRNLGCLSRAAATLKASTMACSGHLR